MQIYYLDSDKKPRMADVVPTGRVLMATARPDCEPASIVPAAAGIAYSFAGMTNLTCADFVEKYVYVEQLKIANGPVYNKVLFDIEHRGPKAHLAVRQREKITVDDVNALKFVDTLGNA